MADAAIETTAVDGTNAIDESTRPAESTGASVVAEAKPAGEGEVAPADAPAEEQAPEAAAATDDQAAKDESTDAKPDPTMPESNGDSAIPADTPASNGTPASGKKANNNRRKSTGGVPEHKSKKTPSKKKTRELHLDTNPGDMWMVAMRGYQPWPVIICDEEMLPESLLSKRPVSAKRIDGTYRDDFKDDGKNAKDRRFPVMFLGTNEFAWQVNYELLPFNIDDVKAEVETSTSTKKNKALSEAYAIAAEGHDLAWFKDMLSAHEEAMQEDILAKQVKAEEKAKKANKTPKILKNTAGDISDDVDMEDAGDDVAPSAKRTKKSNKRKGSEDVESDKPAKTPKQTLKIKTKDASDAKPKKTKSGKKVKDEDEAAEPTPAVEPPMTEEERLEKRSKSVLYLRHRLQKGFLSRDSSPKEDEMPNMHQYIKQLEELDNLEARIIKDTKVHKVLKAIVKLDSIPKEEEYNFKTRSNVLLEKWTSALAADAEKPEAPAAAAPAINGVEHDEKKTDVPAIEAAEETPTEAEPTKSADADGDVTMTETKEDAPASGPVAAEAAAEVAETAAA